MSHTNSTANLSLPQFIGTDKPTWLSDVNGAFAAIDSYAGSNDAALAITDGKADTAIADASNAVTTAGNAATTAGNAAATATAANTVAGNALTVANGINAKVGVLTDLTTTDKSTVVNAINEVNGKDAADIPYDNTGSGLTATDVQAAIDEVAQGGGGGTGLELDTIWTNPDDTQTQNAGTLATLTDQPAYKMFLVEYRRYTADNDYLTMIVFAGKKFKLCSVNGTDEITRNITITVSGTSIDIAVEQSYASGTANYGYNIVSKVYGIK